MAIPNDSPWAGLEVGTTDTRRVNASARWNWFWAVMPRNDISLLMQLVSLPNPLPQLPNLKSLEIGFQSLPSGQIFYVRLKDIAQIELFETFCRDIINAAELAITEREALDRAIGRAFRWHYLLRGGRPEVLEEDEQKGLIGEIQILKLLVDNLGAQAALDAWMGPSGAPKDFELMADSIEVKTRRGASQPFVKISNEHQLADVMDRRLWLSILAVDKVQHPHGGTLAEYVAEVTELIGRTEPSAIMNWDLHLADAGYDELDDYSAWRWIVSTPEFYFVGKDFPRITGPIPIGVSGVTYTVALSACAPYIKDWEIVRSNLVNRDLP